MPRVLHGHSVSKLRIQCLLGQRIGRNPCMRGLEPDVRRRPRHTDNAQRRLRRFDRFAHSSPFGGAVCSAISVSNSSAFGCTVCCSQRFTDGSSVWCAICRAIFIANRFAKWDTNGSSKRSAIWNAHRSAVACTHCCSQCCTHGNTECCANGHPNFPDGGAKRCADEHPDRKANRHADLQVQPFGNGNRRWFLRNSCCRSRLRGHPSRGLFHHVQHVPHCGTDERTFRGSNDCAVGCTHSKSHRGADCCADTAGVLDKRRDWLLVHCVGAQLHDCCHR